MAKSKLDWIFTNSGYLRRTTVCFILGVSGSLALLVYVGSTIDGSLRLPQSDRGLLDHYGVNALFVAAPFCLLLALHALGRFLQLLPQIDRFTTNQCPKEKSKQLMKDHLDSLCLRNSTKWLLVLLSIVGLLFFMVNVRQTLDPFRFYGHDVYDSIHHPIGFALAKIFHFFVFVAVFPVVTFYVGHITVSTWLIFRVLNQGSWIKIDLFAPDQCGGLSAFGAVNFTLMLIYLAPFSAMYFLTHTHANLYPSLIIPLVALSFVFTIQSVVGIYYIYRSIRTAKHRRLESLRDHLSKQLHDDDALPEFPSNVLSLYNHVAALSSFPYSRNIAFGINTLRFLPVAAAILKLVNIV